MAAVCQAVRLSPRTNGVAFSTRIYAKVLSLLCMSPIVLPQFGPSWGKDRLGPTYSSSHLLTVRKTVFHTVNAGFDSRWLLHSFNNDLRAYL